MRQTGSCQVGFVIKTAVRFIDSDLFRLSFSSSSSPEYELSEFSGSAVLLAVNVLVLCKEVS